MIPLFLAEDEENSSSMARQRVFRDLNDPLDQRFLTFFGQFPTLGDTVDLFTTTINFI